MNRKSFVKGANPYMPLWEHVPDGEPRVFNHNGEERVYVYGSHDTERGEYCGRDYVVWSAPVTDLTNWTCHGTCYKAEDDSILYAPDVVKKGDTYYMYAAEQKGSRIMVARSDKPWGPFKDPVLTELGFDPGVLVDDDGRVYAYWGFCKSYCAELNEDMATIIPGSLRENPIPHCRAAWSPEDDAFGWESFFEASSPRKMFGKYVYIFSRRVNEPVPGVYDDCNGFLSYMWSDWPLGGWQWGGDISFNGGEILTDAEGKGIMTFRWGNNHGSVMEVNGQWYVFYHRQTGLNEYSRQAMLEPVDAVLGKNGKVWIGKVDYLDGEPVASRPVEMTSQGPQVNGINAREWISAGYTCHMHGGQETAWIEPVYEQREDVSARVMNITDGLTLGFRYLQFGLNAPKNITVVMNTETRATVSVRLDAPGGREIAWLEAEGGEVTVPLKSGVIGKHAIYFVFNMPEGKAEMDRFTFDD